MIVVVQRVKKAKCIVDNQITGEIEKGFMLLVGFKTTDTFDIALKVATKISKLRIFEDENQKMNKSLFDVNGEILSISQFTLYGDCKGNNRPSFINAMKGEEAIKLYDFFNEKLEELGIKVKKGVFGAMMDIDFINDGPVTILIDSDKI